MEGEARGDHSSKLPGRNLWPVKMVVMSHCMTMSVLHRQGNYHPMHYYSGDVVKDRHGEMVEIYNGVLSLDTLDTRPPPYSVIARCSTEMA